jgi:hypothetical protein
MRARLLPSLAVATALGAAVLAAPAVAAPPETAPGAHPAANAQASDRVVYQYDRSASADHAAKPQRPGSSPNMTYHGGKIMTTAVIRPIFWGTSWGGGKPAFVADKITGLNSWYAGYSGSAYAQASTEYRMGTNGPFVGSNTSSFDGVIDATPASGGGNSGAILAEVARTIPAAQLTTDGYYPVYTDVPRGRAGYCAWHSSGSINGVVVQFAFFWNLDGDPGCDPQDTSGLHSQGLAALANVTGHELAEAMTDPASPGAWYDQQGYENGDKCAWSFPLTNVTLGGQTWKVQGEWSNAAYTAGSGYANSKGQPGCLPAS